MDHGARGGEADATTVGSADLGMAGAVQGGEAHMSTSTFHVQRGSDAARRAGFEPSPAAFHDSAELAHHVVVPVDVLLHLHREPEPGVAYPNIGEFWRQLGLAYHPGGVVQVLDNYGYSFLQPRPRAGRGVVLVDLLPGGGGGGAVYNGDYALQPRPCAGHGEVLVDLLPDGAGHDEVFVSLLPDGVDAVYDDYGYYAWQPRPGAGRGEVFIGPLPDGVGVVFDGSGNLVRQTLPAPGTRGADGIAGALRGPNLGAVYDNRGVVGEHLRRLLPFAGIGASFVAVDGLAAGPGSPAVAFHLFVLLLGGLLLLILHVLRV